MEETKTLPKTSAATPADFLEEFKKAEKNGYEAIIITGISSTLSGQFKALPLQ
jgi:fatty acid-binding protein DegV